MTFQEYVQTHCKSVSFEEAKGYAQKGKEFLDRLDQPGFDINAKDPHRAENMAYLQWHLMQQSFELGKPFGKGMFLLAFEDTSTTQKLYQYFRNDREPLFPEATQSNPFLSTMYSLGYTIQGILSNVIAKNNDNNPTYSRLSSHFNQSLAHPKDGHFGIDAQGVPLPSNFGTTGFGLIKENEQGNIALYIKPETESADLLRKPFEGIRHGFNLIKALVTGGEEIQGLERFAEGKRDVGNAVQIRRASNVARPINPSSLTTAPSPELSSKPIQVSTEELQPIIEQMLKNFYSNDFKSSEDFLNHLKTLDPDNHILQSLKSNSKDDKYGTFTFKLAVQKPGSDIEFQLKKPNAYGGPKTEDYIDRINSKIDTAIILAGDNPQKKAELENLRAFFVKKINEDCQLDHTILKNLDLNDAVANKHFETQHKKARAYIGNAMAMICNTLEGNPDEIKAKIYNEERKSNSTARPELITIRQIDNELVDVNRVAPVNKDRTVSSAKKDEAGVANWLKVRNETYTLYAKKGKIEAEKIDANESYRSASIIPHELIGKGEFNRQLALDTARRNVKEHILPELAKLLIAKGKTTEPLEIDYEMLTLLSPIHKKIDAHDTNNPDATQFSAIRAALNHYQGRELKIDIDGKEVSVKLNAIYHNYGANLGRGFNIEDATNKKAFNLIIDRSLNQLKDKPEFQPFKPWMDAIPTWTKDQKGRIDSLTKKVASLYEEIDNNPAHLTQAEHEQLMELNAKKINNEPFDQAVHQTLSQKFETFKRDTASIEKEARELESKIRHVHVELAEKRAQYFADTYSTLNKQLSKMEKTEKSPEAKNTIEHMRTLLEYTKLSNKGYDSRMKIMFTTATGMDVNETNKRNYQIQSYIQMLNNFNDVPFHKTCKSGKDRTNSAEEMFKALRTYTLKLGRVPLYGESNQSLKQIRGFFEKGFLQGSGNAICGHNMPPGAQQVSAKDVPTNTLNIDPIMRIANLQKGTDALKPKDLAQMSLEYRQFKLNSLEKEKPSLSEADEHNLFAVRQNTYTYNRQYPLFHSTSTQKTQPSENSTHEILSVTTQNTPKQNVNPTLLSHSGKLNWQPSNMQSLSSLTQLKEHIHHSEQNIHIEKDNPDKLKFTFKDIDSCPKCYAKPANGGLSFSLNQSQGEVKEETLAAICKLAVAFAEKGTVFDLSICPPEIKEATRGALEKAIQESGKFKDKPENIPTIIDKPKAHSAFKVQ